MRPNIVMRSLRLSRESQEATHRSRIVMRRLRPRMFRHSPRQVLPEESRAKRQVKPACRMNFRSSGSSQADQPTHIQRGGLAGVEDRCSHSAAVCNPPRHGFRRARPHPKRLNPNPELRGPVPNLIVLIEADPFAVAAADSGFIVAHLLLAIPPEARRRRSGHILHDIGGSGGPDARPFP